MQPVKMAVVGKNLSFSWWERIDLSHVKWHIVENVTSLKNQIGMVRALISLSFVVKTLSQLKNFLEASYHNNIMNVNHMMNVF